MKTMNTVQTRARLKTAIIENATNIVREKGRENLSIRKIATNVGCSLGTIYNVFTNQDEILLHVNAKFLHELFDEISQLPDDPKVTKKEILMHIGRKYLAFGKNNLQVWKALFEHASMDPLPSWYVETIQKAHERLTGLLVAKGVLPKDKAARFITFYWAAMHGLSSILLNRKTFFLNEDLSDLPEMYTNQWIDTLLQY